MCEPCVLVDRERWRLVVVEPHSPMNRLGPDFRSFTYSPTTSSIRTCPLSCSTKSIGGPLLYYPKAAPSPVGCRAHPPARRAASPHTNPANRGKS